MRLLSDASASTRIRIAPPVPVGLFAPGTAPPPELPSANKLAPTPRSIVPASAICWLLPPVASVPAAPLPAVPPPLPRLLSSTVATHSPPFCATGSHVPPRHGPPAPLPPAV